MYVQLLLGVLHRVHVHSLFGVIQKICLFLEMIILFVKSVCFLFLVNHVRASRFGVYICLFFW